MGSGDRGEMSSLEVPMRRDDIGCWGGQPQGRAPRGLTIDSVLDHYSLERPGAVV